MKLKLKALASSLSGYGAAVGVAVAGSLIAWRGFEGLVIGIATFIFTDSGGSIGIGFAVPIDLVQEVIDDLVEYGEVRRALLGVAIQAVDDTEADGTQTAAITAAASTRY